MKPLAIIFLGSLLSANSALALDYTVTAKGGWGEVRVDKSLSDDNQLFSEEGNSLTAGAGLAFDSQLTTGIEATSFKTASFLGSDDRASLSETKWYIGYRINLADHFRIVPAVGASNWKLRLKEGAFETISEVKAGTYRDTDFYGQLNLEFPINDLIAVVSSINYTRYDFGVFRNAQAGVMFQF